MLLNNMTKKILYSIIICSILVPTVVLGANLQEIILRVTIEIDTRIENLNKTIIRIESFKILSDEQRIEISAPVRTAISDLTALRVKVSQDTNMAEALADFKSVTQSYIVYALVMPRTAIILAGERIRYTTGLLRNVRDKIRARLDALPPGTDTLAITQLIGNCDVKLADAEAKVEAANAEILALKPDNGDPTLMRTNLNVLSDARNRIVSAHQALRDARKDLGDAIKLIRELENK